MVKVVVTGISLISALGDLENTWQGIMNGISGIKLNQPFSYFPPLPLALIKSEPSFINDLTLTLIKDLCQQTNLDLPLEDTGVVIGSSRGCQSNWEQFLTSTHSHFSPSWLDTFPHQPSIIVANYIQSNSIVLSPSNACATGLLTIVQGYELIQQERCERVIVGAVETPITPLTITGFTQMKALSNTKCDPFGKNRDGFVLGEGGAMLLLETEASAKSRQAKIYGEILGWGISCDAYKMTSPEAKGDTAIKTIKQCLQRSHLQPHDINYIHAHGTGTILNDRREAIIVKHLFPHFPPISSTKAFTGHTLGASGTMATALSLMSLQQQVLLPNLHYSDFDYDLNFVCEPTIAQLDQILCFGFGFGGQNAVISIGKGN